MRVTITVFLLDMLSRRYILLELMRSMAVRERVDTGLEMASIMMLNMIKMNLSPTGMLDWRRALSMSFKKLFLVAMSAQR